MGIVKRIPAPCPDLPVLAKLSPGLCSRDHAARILGQQTEQHES
jgi:hypothetical protein